jgi:predicted transport protein
MALFEVEKGTVRKVPPSRPGLERNTQTLFEKNLEEILNITFLASEYSTSFGGRIDTLGIDHNGSPAIVEYKKNQNDNVINQGLSYLRWLLDHKAEFTILLQERKVQRSIDWASPRVICIAESYNKFDLDTVAILPIRVELLRYEIYENGILLVEPEAQQKLRTPPVSQRNQKAIRGTQQYTVKDHLAIATPEMRRVFESLKEKIVALDEAIIEEPKKKYIAYKLSSNFVDIVVLRDSLKLFLNLPTGKLDDPHGLARDLTKPRLIGHWGNGDYEVKLDKKSDIEKAFELVKQSYQYHK